MTKADGYTAENKFCCANPSTQAIWVSNDDKGSENDYVLHPATKRLEELVTRDSVLARNYFLYSTVTSYDFCYVIWECRCTCCCIISIGFAHMIFPSWDWWWLNCMCAHTLRMHYLKLFWYAVLIMELSNRRNSTFLFLCVTSNIRHYVISTSRMSIIEKGNRWT